ncbi:MAG: hypothetical protein MUF81_04565 [Verrucomicrobia bacterium]|nr:hypothetical protein [Verrucomicrobiota bacterium]
MKTLLLFLCFTTAAFGQYKSDVSRSLDGIRDELSIQNIQRSQEQHRLQQQREADTWRQVTDNFGQIMLNNARLRGLQREREQAAEVQAETRRQIEQLRSEREAALGQAKPADAPADRFQLLNANGIILKLDKHTGESWHYFQNPDGTFEWESQDQARRRIVFEKLVQVRTEALNKWEREGPLKNPAYANSTNFQAQVISQAQITVTAREEKLQRFLTSEELVEEAEAAYQDLKKSEAINFVPDDPLGIEKAAASQFDPQQPFVEEATGRHYKNVRGMFDHLIPKTNNAPEPSP